MVAWYFIIDIALTKRLLTTFWLFAIPTIFVHVKDCILQAPIPTLLSYSLPRIRRHCFNTKITYIILVIFYSIYWSCIWIVSYSLPFPHSYPIPSAGFALNTAVVSVLILRYMRKDGTLRFGDFVSAVLHLSVAFSQSIAINDS